MAKAKKREDGRYAVSLSLANGKRKYFYSTESRHAAEVKKAQWVKLHPDLMEGDKIDSRITVSAWAERWLESYKSGLEGSTKRGYIAALTGICSFVFPKGQTFGSMRVSEVRAAHCSQYVNSLSGYSKSLISQRRVVLRQLFGSAVENEIISVSPAEKLPRVKGTYEGHKALTRKEAAIITDNYQGHRFGLPAMLMMWAGLRKQEAISLRKSDIDLKHNVIRISHAIDTRTGAEKATKTENSVRDIPIFAPLRLPLQKALRGLRDDEFLFSKEDGKPLTDAWISPALTSFLRYIEAKTGKEMEFTCHDLRDTFATMCYDAGVDVQTTAKWMGHSNVMTTLKIYTKLSAEKHEESVERMNDFVSEVI